MGILEGLKRTLNIAGTKSIVVLEDNKFSQSEVIKGELVITAPEYKQAGNSIKIELKEFWTVRISRTDARATKSKTRAEIGLLGAFNFEPKSEHKFPFEAQLPRNCRISTADTGWYLGITIDIPNARDRVKEVFFKIRPAKEFLSIIKVCKEKLGFQLKSTYYWHPPSSRTYFRLLPLKALRSELDYLDIRMAQEEDGGVKGDLIFNLQEKTIGDYFKALMRKDLVKRHFHLASSQIFSDDGKVNSGEIAKVIGGAMRKITEQRRPY